MNQKTRQQALMSTLHQTADELLQAHQALMDNWYDSWVDDQRARVAELLRKRHQTLDTTSKIRRRA